jgi:flagellar basal body-associated protein FliL
MNKKTLTITIAAVLVIALAVVFYFYWKNKTNTGMSALDQMGEARDRLNKSATRGVLPSIQTNPLENKPDINPADKANPYKNIITNPFE